MHTAERSIAYLLFLRSCRQFCARDGALTRPPRSPNGCMPLNYPFSILCSGKALKDVIDYVKDTISLSYEIGTVPVFTQTSLTYIYRELIVHHRHAYESIGAQSFAEAAHAARCVKLLMLPDLCVAKSGRQVTLTVDDEVGRALFEACAWSDEDNERVLNKAAKIVRKDLLVSYEICDGDVSEKRQSCSVSNSLVNLISMILEGGEPSPELSAGLQKVSVNLSQLIRFNSVKQKRQEGTQKFRHSRNSEPPLPVLIGLMVHARTGKRKLVDRMAAEGVSISYDRVMNHISNQLCME